MVCRALKIITTQLLGNPLKTRPMSCNAYCSHHHQDIYTDTLIASAYVVCHTPKIITTKLLGRPHTRHIAVIIIIRTNRHHRLQCLVQSSSPGHTDTMIMSVCVVFRAHKIITTQLLGWRPKNQTHGLQCLVQSTSSEHTYIHKISLCDVPSL